MSSSAFNDHFLKYKLDLSSFCWELCFEIVFTYRYFLRFGLSPFFETFFELERGDLFVGLVSSLRCNLCKRGQDNKTAGEKTKGNGYKKLLTVIFEVMSQWSLAFIYNHFGCTNSYLLKQGICQRVI